MSRLLFPSLAALALAGTLGACGSKDKATEQTAQTTTTAPAAEPAATPPTAEPAVATQTSPTAAATFDLSTVPVSSASLGRFPYLSALKGYHTHYDSDSVGYDFERSYVYDGKQLIAVEGKVVRRQFRPVDDKKRASDLMIQRNYEDLVKGLGGVKVSSGKVPAEVQKSVGDEYDKHNGDITSDAEVDTYLIRQKDKEVWVQVVPNETNTLVYVTERAAMPQQASTLKADELKKN